MNLVEIIKNLITTGKEGDYWDFKREKHKDNVELVHDIICLANSSYHIGDRFLVFGIQNNLDILGIDPNEKQTQANIINTLRNARFAGGVFPDIHLETIQLDGKNIEVIIIKDRSNERPYYLEKEYHKHKLEGSQGKHTGCIVRAGTIYTRTRDSNTPINSVASTAAIEKMWRQRFGLDLSPLERMTQYLLDFDSWEEIQDETNNTIWHHRMFPEYTIKRSFDAKNEVASGESWVRFGMDPTSHVYNVEFRYHQTIIKVEEQLSYDAWMVYLPCPLNKYLFKEIGIFYYYLEDSFSFKHLQFSLKNVLTSNSDISAGRINPPLVIFKNKKELEEFCCYLNSKFTSSEFKDISFYMDKAHDWCNNPQDILNLQLCLFVKEHLPKWRNSHAK